LSFVLPALILLTALRPAGIEKPSNLERRVRKVAFVSAAAPIIFVFLGVLLYIAGNPVPDGVSWAAMWIATIDSYRTRGSASPKIKEGTRQIRSITWFG
jgi:hypothetical protein